MIYVKRNVKDVVVSYFHFSKIVINYTGSIEDFVDCFTDDSIVYSPYMRHVQDFEEAAKKYENILMLSYEDMKKVMKFRFQSKETSKFNLKLQDLRAEIKIVAKFLDIKVTEQKIEEMCEHLSIQKMQGNSVNSSATTATFKAIINLQEISL